MLSPGRAAILTAVIASAILTGCSGQQAGSDTSVSPTSPQVDTGGGTAQISAGGGQTCSLSTGGGVKCWGGNSYGALGDGTTTSSNTPVQVTGLTSGVTAISVGGDLTCALTSEGAVKCWGQTDEVRGDGDVTTSNTPEQVAGLGSGVTAISADRFTSCVITTGGAAKCWGGGEDGTLGNGTKSSSDTPVQVSGLDSGVTAISVGFSTTCAVTKGGAAKCWGDSDPGGLGNATTSYSATPVQVSGLDSGVTAIGVGANYACVLTTDGAVKCWGNNSHGQLGGGSYSYPNSKTPVQVSGLTSGVTAISVGFSHACALTTDGAIKCWGSNASGQLGNGTDTDSNTPVQVVGL